MIAHALTLEVDRLRQRAEVGRDRLRSPTSPILALHAADQARQSADAHHLHRERLHQPHRRWPTTTARRCPARARTYELTGLALAGEAQSRFTLRRRCSPPRPGAAVDDSRTSRPRRPACSRSALIEQHAHPLPPRTTWRGALPLGELESLALPFETLQAGVHARAAAEVYGERVTDAMMLGEGGYVHSDGDADWWLPSGPRVLFARSRRDTPAQELAYARAALLPAASFRDPFQ